MEKECLQEVERGWARTKEQFDSSSALPDQVLQGFLNCRWQGPRQVISMYTIFPISDCNEYLCCRNLLSHMLPCPLGGLYASVNEGIKLW